MSTASQILRLELIATGDQAGTWGTTTNTNLGTLLEGSIAGLASVSVTSANQALTATDYVADQARMAILTLTTTTLANFSVYAPPVSKTYVIYNNSSYDATIYNSTVIGNTTAAGLGVTIPSGKVLSVWSNGTNFYKSNTTLTSLTTDVTGTLPVANGGTGATTFTAGAFLKGAGTSAVTTAATVALGSEVSGTLPVANGGTGASDAGTARTNLGLGSIATQAASAVSISGGSITGVSVSSLSSDLAIADGGTGQSTALAAFDALKQAASDTYTGVVELATTAEVQTGTDTTRVLTPASLRGGALVRSTRSIISGNTEVDFTGLPSWVTRITILFADGLSTNGTSPIVIRLGDSGGFLTTGYQSAASFTSSAGGYLTSTAGLLIDATNTAIASYTRYGAMTLLNTGVVLSSTYWVSTSNVYANGSQVCTSGAGGVSLSNALTQVRVTTLNGTDTFDSGLISLIYE